MQKHNYEHFCNKVVLVTGASGFIGSHLCGVLKDLGAEVHATSRSERKSADLQWWQADLLDVAAVRKLFSDIRPEIIFHLSGHVTAAPDLQLVLSTFESLVASTINLLTVATEMGCERFLMTGSLTEPQALDRRDPIPSSPYSAAKWASGVYGRMFHLLYNSPVVTVRPFMTYGPAQGRLKIVPYVVLSLIHGEIPKVASGEWQADWIYIEDVIEGMLLAAQRNGLFGQTIDLGSGLTLSVRSVVDKIVALLGSSVVPSYGALADRPAEEIRVADAAHAYEVLGWRSVISLEDGLKRTIDWYRSQDLYGDGLFGGKESK